MEILTQVQLILATLTLSINLCYAEVFTAMADMEHLLQAERQVVGAIDQYINAEMNRLKKLREVAAEYHQKNKMAIRKDVNYLSNPVNAYLLIKHLTTNWEDVEGLMKYNTADYFLKNITEQREMNNVKMPDDEDLTGAATALLRLQDTYNLEANELADGKIDGVSNAETLSAGDCYQLGRIAYFQRDYYHTLIWMQEAYNRMEHEDPPTADEAEILEHLGFAMYQQGNVKRALQLTKRLYQIAPEHPRAAGNVKYYTDQLEEEGVKPDGNLPSIINARTDALSKDNEFRMYESLCRGERKPSVEMLNKLKCYYKADRPFLRLAPLKVEEVHLKPKIVIFRKVLSDHEIEVIKELAAPKLKRATVKGADGTLITVEYRIAKSAWLEGRDDPVVERVNQRIDHMTNLEMKTAELLQVANYGLGGHYEPHFDMSTRGERDPYFDGTGNRIATALFYSKTEIPFKNLGTGNRIATALFYMEAPEAGGATVFTRLNLTLFPTKYDAAFWHNIKKSGESDLTTRHAGCPVLAGLKWVSNKWIHERGNEFRRPCSLSPNEYE